MSRILLTGGTGLVGQRFLDLHDREHEILCLSRQPPSSRSAFINADLNVTIDVATLPPAVDTVLYLAQSRGHREFPQSSNDLFSVNVAGVQQMLEWARTAGARRFILASTGGVYGTGNRPFNEDDPIATTRPMSYYEASKLAAESLARCYSAFFDVIILRPFFVYGPQQRTQMLIPRLVESVRVGNPIKLQGPDGIAINPIFVDDAVEAIAGCLRLNGSHTINIAGPEVLTLREICTIIGENLRQKPDFVSHGEGPSPCLSGDIERMSRLLGAPSTSFASAVRLLLASPDEQHEPA